MKRLALAVVVGLSVCAAGAQGTSPAPTRLAYEVVSIRQNKSESGMMMWNSTSTGIKMENVTLRMLVNAAYALRSPNDDQVTGLPKWGDDEHFDVEAKVSADDLDAYKKLKFEDQAPLLLAALEDRFQLKAHKEKRELPTYSLVVAKGGPKIKPAKEGDTYENGIKFKDKPGGAGTMTVNMDGSTYHAEFQGVPLESFAQNLSYQVHREVTDDTGLKGKYDIKLDWSPDDARDPAVPGILTAIQEQLGLKLVPSKGPVECVVVEHAEQPSEN